MDKVFSCGQAIKNAAPGLSDRDVEEVLSAIIRRERAMPNRRGDALRWAEVAAEKTAEERLALQIEKHARQAALIARVRRETAYSAYDDPIRAISDRISTSSRAGAGVDDNSAEGQINRLMNGYRGALLTGWNRAGVLPWLRHITPEQESALAREIARLNGGQGIEATTNAQIRRAAEVVVALQAKHREDANAAGAWVQQLDGRVSRTSHDARRMEAAGYQTWRDFVAPRLSDMTWERAGIDPGDTAAAEKFLRDVYANLVSGNHTVVGKGELDPLSGFSAPGSLARKLSEDRVLHWRGPDEWLAYNREFGTANLVAMIVSESEHAARSIGLMSVWGPNPEAAFKQDVTNLGVEYRDVVGDLGAVRSLGEAVSGGQLRREWAIVTGEAERPASARVAHFGAAWRALESMTSLGGMVLSALGVDNIATAMALRHEGVPIMETLRRQFLATLPGNPLAQREVALHYGAGLNNMMGGLYHRLGYDQNLSGRISKGMDIFFKLNLQNWWQDSLERGVVGTLSSHVAKSLDRGWGEISPRMRAGLERFGITEADWQAAQAAGRTEIGGYTYFVTDALQGDAARRWGAYMSETINSALTRPGVTERSIITGGMQAGTVGGEAVRMLMQFKGYPLAFANRHLTREWHRGAEGAVSGWPERAANVGGLIAATTLMGYVAMTLKELAAGREPRQPDDTKSFMKTLGRAMTQGGGLGIYGDFIFGDYNRFGGGFIDTLAGPAAGTLSQAGRIFANLRDTEYGNAASGAVGFALREVLPTNIFYAKLALDHLIVYQLQEAVNPGYLRRLERRVERENDQQWWAPPTNATSGWLIDALR